MISPYMVRKGLTQVALSKLTGIAQPTISAYVRQTAPILPKHAKKLRKALGIPLHVMCPDVWPAPKKERAE